MRSLDRAAAAWDRAVERSRRRSPRFDHVWRARERYGAMYGPRLAAAIAYYGFFAAFALSLVAYSILGFLLASNHAVINTVNRWLARNLPFLKPEDISNARQTLAVLSLVGLVLAGVGWVDGMRSSQRAMWELEQQPGNVVVRWLIDLGMLFGLGLLLTLSLWMTSGINDGVRVALDWITPSTTTPRREFADNAILSALGQALSFGVNLLMAAGLLVAVPRLRVSPRRMLGPVLLVAIGVTFLTTVGRFYVNRVAHNPAYKVMAGAAGLLVFLNLFSQLLLFGAAFAATSRRGTVTDLATKRAPADT